MSTLIVGLFSQTTHAAAAVSLLEMQGVDGSQINLVASDSFDKDSFSISVNSKLPEGVALGATTGAAVTALVAGLTGVGAVVSGGLGLVVSGPVVAALAGAGAGAAGGSVIGGLVGASFPEHEVKYMEDAIEKGSVLVGVEYNAETKDLIKETFEQCHVDKISMV